MLGDRPIDVPEGGATILIAVRGNVCAIAGGAVMPPNVRHALEAGSLRIQIPADPVYTCTGSGIALPILDLLYPDRSCMSVPYPDRFVISDF